MGYKLTETDKQIKKLLTERIRKNNYTGAAEVKSHKCPLYPSEFRILKGKRDLLKLLKKDPKARVVFIYNPTTTPIEVSDFNMIDYYHEDLEFNDLYKFSGHWKKDGRYRG